MDASTLPPATSYHRLPIRVINGAVRALNSMNLAKTRLDEDSLLAAARKQTGLNEFGDERFLEPMRLLLDSLENEAELNPLGRFMNRMSIVRLLKNRLYVHDLITRHPEILQREIKAPVVVVGLARSGTTRLHRLLATDERFLHLKAWESVNPVPLPASFTTTPDPRITSIEEGLKAVLYMSPQIASVHPLGAHEVEEEVGLIQHGFSSQLFEIQAKIPSFAEWLMIHSQLDAYEYMVTLLKVVSWFRKDPPDKTWVLKTPQHMQDLDSLIHVFPDAKLVCSHRDPVKAVGSACSMTWNSIVRDTDRVSPQAVGRDWLEKTERMLKKTQQVRQEMIPQENQYDVLYADIGEDWQKAVAGIYDFLQRDFCDQAKADMQQWVDGNKQHKHGQHKYRLEDFGLSSSQVDDRLSFYRRHYNIPYESKNPHLTAK
ncbi:MAG: sulfotransferase [Halioglobus sp.]